MLLDEKEDTTVYKVVVNHEEQYSIWPADRPNPPGWDDGGKSGNKQDCLAHIKEVWTDMRPLSLRKKMAEAASRAPEPPAAEPPQEADGPAGPTPDGLVNRLAAADHPVEISLRPDRTPQRLKEAIERGYVFVKFTGTRGGTELGVRLDPAESKWNGADLDAGKGTVHLVGRLTLNYVKVRCLADVDLATFAGKGHLEPDAPGAAEPG